ncbi:MAG: alanyl-tRNA editing protein [Chloroflexi bacterium]|nr:alanyl-tRNA editing protein [Chloroflexota bacterium]
MTELLCQSDAYLKDFDAAVTVVNGDQIVLDRTAFYPRGGGQPSDHGTLWGDGGEYRVLEVKKQGGEVWHKLDRAATFAVGARVRGAIDWERRYKLMRTHTALHILCGVIWRDYGVSVTGGDMEPLAARMDFELEHLSADFAHQVEEKVNAEIAAARDIRVKVLPREEAFQIPDLIRTKINLLPPDILQVRTVEIVGLDLQADGGTHVANTREVGRIKIVGHESKGKINKRLRIEIGD